VVLAGSLLIAAESLLDKGIHPTTIAESFTRAAAKSKEYLTAISKKVDLNDRESLLKSASTSLNSKVFFLVGLYIYRLYRNIHLCCLLLP
jgi:T-complex protein 1 subunit delta